MATRALIVDLSRDDIRLVGEDLRRREATILLGYRRRSPRVSVGDEVLALGHREEGATIAGRGRIVQYERMVEGVEGFDSPVLILDLEDWEVPDHSFTLAQLAPSLAAVWNPFRPRRSLKHRGWIGPGSAEAAVLGLIEPTRTAFFGLLAPMKAEWRAALLIGAVQLERQWRAESEVAEHASNPGGVPLRALLYLLQIAVGTPVALGAAIDRQHRRLFPARRGPLRVSESERLSDAWDTEPFLRIAAGEDGIGDRLDRMRGGQSDELVDSEWADVSAENGLIEDFLQ